MKLQFTKADPMGNTTIFVWSDVPRNKQPYIARQLMKPDYLCAEQVGFVEKPSQPDAIARLQMMGGELSVNATLAFATVLSKRENTTNLKVEVSGCERLVECVVENLEQPQICLPLPKGNLVKATKAKIGGSLVPTQIVNLTGISYFLVDENLCKSTGLDYKRELKNLQTQFPSDTAEDAWGLIFCRETRIKPIVYVKETNTAVQEKACGSASLALALAKGYTEVIQPSGEIIRVNLQQNQATIEGRVTIVAEGLVNVS